MSSPIAVEQNENIRSLPAPRLQLSEEVARYVKELIVTGQVRPGSYLRLKTLAEQLQLSPTPVREGLLILRGEGLVELEPRKGFVVSPLTKQDIQDFFVAQSLLAGELCARAATRIDGAQMAQLEEVDQALKHAAQLGDAKKVERLNHQFHRIINLSAQSAKLVWMLNIATEFAPRQLFEKIPGWLEASAKDHDEVVSALRQRDENSARTNMRRHIEHAGQLLAENFELFDDRHS